MRNLLVALALLLCCFSSGATTNEPGPTCNLFLLIDSPDGPTIEIARLAEGEERVFDLSRVISFTLPYGVGQSGEVIKGAERGGKLIARLEDGSLIIRKQGTGGEEKNYPIFTLDQLAQYDIRLNISPGTGEKVAFNINAWEEVEIDRDAPVIDMFRGMIPLAKGDFAITSEIKPHEGPSAMTGSARLYFTGNHLLVKAMTPSGQAGDFIVDFGAGASTIAKKYLANDAVIEKMYGIEYSQGGSRQVEGVMEGLGGVVEGFLGTTRVAELILGDLQFIDETFNVDEEPLMIDGREIAGVIGMNLLRHGDVVSLIYGDQGDTNGLMEFKSEPSEAGIQAMPFHIVAKHIFLSGKINGVKSELLFDTGARASMLDKGSFPVGQLSRVPGKSRDFHGADGRPIPAQAYSAREVEFGENRFQSVNFYVGDFPILKAMGLSENGGILGNDFLRKFARIEVDFREGRILLVI